MIYITEDYAVLAVTDSGGFGDEVVPQYITYTSEDVTDLDMFI